MRAPMHWLLALACIVTGCTSEPRFNINGKVMEFPTEKQQAVIQSVWPAGILETVAAHSRAPASDHGQILAVIGETERQGTAVHPSCSQLKLVAIENWEPVRLQFAADKFMVAPKTYLDHWRVEGCGMDHSWLVYDDKARGGELSITHTELPQQGQPTKRIRVQ